MMRAVQVMSVPLDRDLSRNVSGVESITRNYVTMAIDEALDDIKAIWREWGYGGAIGYTFQSYLFDPANFDPATPLVRVIRDLSWPD